MTKLEANGLYKKMISIFWLYYYLLKTEIARRDLEILSRQSIFGFFEPLWQTTIILKPLCWYRNFSKIGGGLIDTFFLESKIWYDGHESFNNNLSFLADRPHELLELMFEPRHLQKHTCPYEKRGNWKKN